MHVRRRAFGRLDASLYRLLWVAKHRAQEIQRRHAGGNDLLIRYRALIARAPRSPARISGPARLKQAAPLFFRIICGVIEHRIRLAWWAAFGGFCARYEGHLMAELDGLLHDYLSHGRRLEALDVAELERRWIASVQHAQRAPDDLQGKFEVRHELVDALREMNHIEAELQLRGLEPPKPAGHKLPPTARWSRAP
jgi:hypothetical protein